jgi:formylglycine-generating enzyme required for sulfatase activity
VTHLDPANPATISDFQLDTFEISVGRFRAFVEAGYGVQGNPPSSGQGAHDKLPGSGWQASWNSKLAHDTAELKAALTCAPHHPTWVPEPSKWDDGRAINCITWYEALAFCIWDGGRLPTEAEWNYAAAGGSEQRVYPWSTPPDSAAIDHEDASYEPNFGAIAVGGFFSPKGDGRYGQADLAGSVWEWVLDGYEAAYPNPCADCANLNPTGRRSYRGGCYFSEADQLTASYRHRAEPESRTIFVGARCARKPGS